MNPAALAYAESRSEDCAERIMRLSETRHVPLAYEALAELLAGLTVLHYAKQQDGTAGDFREHVQELVNLVIETASRDREARR